MFHVKCIDCKNFDRLDGCKLNLDDETCTLYEQIKTDEQTVANCENCVWQSNGFCDWDFLDSSVCRRFKDKKDQT